MGRGLRQPRRRRGDAGSGAEHLRLQLQNLAVCAIAVGIALRYFYVSHQWQANVEAEAQSRVRALQARIRPHFLFNSMNTIASLTRSNPQVAEQAIADLSDLFRASLREHRERIPLAHEIEIARAYERVERLRLGERLQVDWQVDGLPMDAKVPALILQPLLENAVYHGIEPLDKGGVIRVSGRQDGKSAVLTIDNPVSPRVVGRRPGHRIGLDNVRQRLELMFHGEAEVEVIEAPERFVVTLRFPAGGAAHMNLRVLVVDDEPLARERLSHLVEELPAVELAGVASSGEEALLLAGRLRPEVVLLDIRMPGMDGLEAAHHLARMPEPPAVIFTTAFEQHALAAFDAQAAGYLLKPVRPDKLKEALERARRPTRAQLARIAEGTGGARTRIAVRMRDELRLIPVEDIICFIAEQKYTTLRHLAARNSSRSPLKALEEEFAAAFRAHAPQLTASRSRTSRRSSETPRASVVRLRGGAALPVSRRLAAEVTRRVSR